MAQLPQSSQTVTTPKRSPEEIVKALAAFPDELERAIAGQPQEALMQPSSDGGWGVVELVPHLRDWEKIFLGRVEAILSQDEPYLPAFDDQLWAVERGYRDQETRAALEEFRAVRANLVSLLDPTNEAQWQRTGIHGTWGRVTLHWLLDVLVDSDEDHLNRIRDALA
jgi:hypothetical protein